MCTLSYQPRFVVGFDVKLKNPAVALNELGDRFVNEGAARDELARAVYAQPNSQMWLVVNTVRYPTPTTPDSNGETIQDMLALDAINAAYD